MSLKFSIVTPTFNSARFIREAIQSVISQQGTFSIEYFVVDNCSTDSTQEIVEQFQMLLKSGIFPLGCDGVDLYFVSESDKGMYDAINKGFAKATGDIYAWINSDDVYLPGAFSTMARVFATYTDIHWAKGVICGMTETSSIWWAGTCQLYNQEWVKSGIYGRDRYFIEQESVFWRSWLWQRCGGIDSSLRMAGDYYLWVKLSELTSLVSVASWVSCFRRVEGQISQDRAAYMKEVSTVSPGRYNKRLLVKVRLFSLIEKWLPALAKPFLYRLLFGRADYTLVLIDAHGQLTKITGEYCDVKRL